jgi:ornithine carbamoyltransferase
VSATARRTSDVTGQSSEQAAGPRHFLDLRDFDTATLRQMLDVASGFKRAGGVSSRPLAGKTLALIFEKPSTRTRVSFEVGMRQLGGDVVVLTGKETQPVCCRAMSTPSCCAPTTRRNCTRWPNTPPSR